MSAADKRISVMKAPIGDDRAALAAEEIGEFAVTSCHSASGQRDPTRKSVFDIFEGTSKPGLCFPGFSAVAAYT
jgi:hypothetical protein